MQKYKVEIFFISLISVLIILFPPIQESKYDAGYSFFFSIGSDYSINYLKLLIEFILLGFLTVIFIIIKPYVKLFVKNLIKLISRFLFIVFLISLTVGWFLYSSYLLTSSKPSSMEIIPEKYWNEILDYNDNEEAAYSFYEVFSNILINDVSVIKYFPLPRSLFPDVTPYLIEKIDRHKSFLDDVPDNFLIQDYIWIKDFEKIYIPPNKELTGDKKEIYHKKLYDIKKDYIKSIKPDAQLYVKDYDNYNFWKNFVRFSGTVLLSLLTIFILFRRMKKKNSF